MRHSSLRTQAVALGILVVASVVGNVSLSASRVRSDAPTSSIAATPRDSFRVASTTPTTSDQTALPSKGAASDSASGGQVVPAIYSWDPDVTFVFYRHVTKWM